MRTKIFFFAMFASMTASAQVTNVEPVSANYANKTVSFRVWWNAGSRDATHLSKVWMWVDYITVNSDNTTSGNLWARALVSGTPTTTGGTVARETGNDKGFWLTGNASTNYSATVTAQLNITANKFNWCAYGSDFPPNAVENGSSYILKGSPPFIITTSSGTFQENTKSFSGGTITALTDATGCPGVQCGKDGESPGLLNCCSTGTFNYDGVCKLNSNTCESCARLVTDYFKLAQWDGTYCWVTDKTCPVSAGTASVFSWRRYVWDGSQWYFEAEIVNRKSYCGSYTKCNY